MWFGPPALRPARARARRSGVDKRSDLAVEHERAALALGPPRVEVLLVRRQDAQRYRVAPALRKRVGREVLGDSLAVDTERTGDLERVETVLGVEAPHLDVACVVPVATGSRRRSLGDGSLGDGSLGDGSLGDGASPGRMLDCWKTLRVWKRLQSTAHARQMSDEHLTEIVE